MKNILANGRLQHYVRGCYVAHIMLVFESPEAALEGQKHLNKKTLYLPGWRPYPGFEHCLIWSGGPEELEETKIVLGGFGANAATIDSNVYHNEYGEPFKILIPAG